MLIDDLFDVPPAEVKENSMIRLPDSEILIRGIREGLNAVADRHTVSELLTGDWFPEIAGEIASRVRGPNVECYARGRRRAEPARDCKGSEWLFDFCALINDPDVKEEDRFMAQAAVVGEVEWARGGTDQDFEKLMVADALVLFFVWQEIVQNALTQLSRYFEAAERRQEYCQQRGMSRLPAFLLSCWVYPEGKFVHKVLV